MTKEQLFACVGSLDDDLLECSEQPQISKRPQWKWLALAACAVLVIGLGIWFPFRTSEYSGGGIDEVAIDQAPLWEDGNNDLGACPADKTYTHKDAMEDVKFGKYIPSLIPEMFTDHYYLRIQNEREDSLVAVWESSEVTGNETEEDIWSSVEWRVSDEPYVGAEGFAAEELTPEKVAEYCSEAEAGSGSFWMSFYVDYGDVFVQICAADVDPITVYEMLKQIQ